jgi:hypothetical protein
MLYTKEEFSHLDEAHALTDLLKPISPMLYTVLTEARADLQTRYPSDLFWEHQNRQNLSRMVNQRAARLWPDSDSDSWALSDHTGFLHLRETATGLKMILRKVDPITRHVPKSNATKTNRVYFSQRNCIGVGRLNRVSQGTLFDEGKFAPDLSSIGLVCVWDELLDEGIAITVYKTSSPGRYGNENPYFFKYELHDSLPEDTELKYTASENEYVDLLPDLLEDYTGQPLDDDSKTESENRTPDAPYNNEPPEHRIHE